MAGLLYEYILHPIIAAAGGEITGLEILFKIALFLFVLLAVMYGMPALMVLFS